MKNLGSRWTVPDIARTAAARSSFLIAISSERYSDSNNSNTVSNNIGSSRGNSKSSHNSSISIKSRRTNVRSSDSGSNGIESIGGGIRVIEAVTAYNKKRDRRRIGRSAIDVLHLHEAHLSVRSYVTASSNRIDDGTTRSESTPRHRPLAGKSCGSQHRYRPRQPQPQPQPQPPQPQSLYYPPASWDTRTLQFRNC